MKKFTSLLIGVSLALAGAAFAQQPEEQASPKKEKPATEKTEKAEPKTPKTRGENAAKPEATAKQTGATNEPGAGKGRKAKATEKSATATATETGVSGQTGATPANEPGAGKGRKAKATEKSTTATGAETNASAEPGASASVAPGGKKAGREKGTKAGAGPNANAKASAAPSVTPATAASASAAPTVATATGQQNAQATGGIAANKPNPQQVQQAKQKVQQIKQQHANFRAQPKPDKVPAVTFTQNYRIQGSESWQGPQYEVFRSYRPERHDRTWYHSHYTRVELIGGGYYFWNNGYWYPAWGYDPGAEYYAYDAPIYVGHRAEPPDRVIADVQAELQEMGYYRGEVDGLLGPLTREALTAYQADQGLMTTAVIDEPTLDSLGMG